MNNRPIVPAAVILAAGESKRMGRPKLLLPWGQETVIGKIVRTLGEAGVEEIIVVTGGAGPQVEEALRGSAARCLRNPNFAAGEMLSSCQAGLQALSAQAGAALIVLGDQPQIETGVVKSLLERLEMDRPELLVPSYQMRRGHPWVVARKLWPEILALRSPATLRDFLIQHADQITYLQVESTSILQDLDTPADYERYLPSF